MLTAIRQWVIKTMMKNNTGVVQTLPKKQLIELNTQITAQRLMQNGIEPEALKNVNQVENAVNAIDNRPRVIPGTSTEGQAITEKLFGKRGEVFDMQGNKLDPNESIMGGTQINEKSLKEGLMKTDNPYSNLVKTTKQKPKTLKEREAEVLAGMEKNNKEAVQRIRNRKMVKDAVDNASPGFVSGDRKYNAQLVAEDLADKRFGKDFYDLDQKQQSDIYGEALDGLDDVDKFATGGRVGLKIGTGEKFLKFLKKFKVKQSGDDAKDFLSKRKFMQAIVGNTEKNQKARQLAELKENLAKYREQYRGYQFPSDEQIKIDLEKRIQPILNKDRKLNATGGRIGYKVGSVDKMRRLILKAMGAGTVGIGAAKSGIFTGLGKGAGKTVAKEVVQQSTSTPPPYFFELANKIKTLGKATDGPSERLKIHTMPAKDGKSELMLTEDIGTGEMQIKKIGKEGDEMTTEVQTMEYTPGSSQADEATKGIPADQYDEYTEFNSRIYKDNFNEPMIEDGIKVDEIIEEVKDQAPSIKKAGGGIARMLGE